MIDQDRLTAIDVASLLHIGRNAVYDLAKSGGPGHAIRSAFLDVGDGALELVACRNLHVRRSFRGNAALCRQRALG